jgi:hypothetical protein
VQNVAGGDDVFFDLLVIHGLTSHTPARRKCPTA